jgi:hypothetical protein
MAEARRRGRHLYVRDWHVGVDLSPAEAVEAMLQWCRETLANCRRPFGIDYFDLFLALSTAGDRRARSVEMEKLRIADLYEESFAEKLLGHFRPRDSDEGPHGLRVSLAIFSWGDAAHEALPATW